MKKMIILSILSLVATVAILSKPKTADPAPAVSPVPHAAAVQDVNVSLHTGRVINPVHKKDFSGWFYVISDATGFVYCVDWDPEDFTEGDRVIFSTYEIDPQIEIVTRVHAHSMNFAED